MSGKAFTFERCQPKTYRVFCFSVSNCMIGIVTNTPDGWEHDLESGLKFNTRNDAASSLLNRWQIGRSERRTSW